MWQSLIDDTWIKIMVTSYVTMREEIEKMSPERQEELENLYQRIKLSDRKPNIETPLLAQIVDIVNKHNKELYNA